MSGKRHLRTSEVATLAGVSIATLRYYERRGLISPPSRTASGYRSFDPDTVVLVRLIKGAQALGFTLKEIHELIRLRRDEDATCQQMFRTARDKLTDLDEQIARLQRQREELVRVLDTCPRDREATAIDCPMFGRLEQLGRDGVLP